MLEKLWNVFNMFRILKLLEKADIAILVVARLLNSVV